MSRIVKCTLQSPHPIIDPLSRTVREHLTGPERSRGNQIAIHILATCRALHEEGTRYLWESNTVVFTTPEALRHFAELSPEHRNKITSVNLRVIARYYDDRQRSYKLEEDFGFDMYGKPSQLVNILSRPKESRPIRGGLRSYSGYQLADFLMALRAPYDPNYQDKHIPRPRLLPSLSLLRLDLVNFVDAMLPSVSSHSELHEVTSREFGYTLNELQITGMPNGTTGRSVSEELTCMLKDEGLFLHGCPTYIAQTRQLEKLSCKKWRARVVRATIREGPSPVEDDAAASDDEPSVDYTQRLGILPPAPNEEGHPALFHDQTDVIWKRIPFTRDSNERRWVPFSRAAGREMPVFELGAGEDGRCPHDGEGPLGAPLLRHSILRYY
ncbi:hypothetical protein E4U52_007215 [Claviceps spartinae]|nr:hypothetical protein E4U52_007215 [Claviceps spartinae]